MDKFTEGEDYYYNDEGFVVLTAKYHLKRGHCCGNGCKHCPFDFINVPEPKKQYLLSLRQDEKNKNGS